ncbi:MAG TPA: cell division protein FtsH, partial [Acidaminococcaceae bacterium]|nr:cell division protein FtsH [Acidaminococcaceae bacterium]
MVTLITLMIMGIVESVSKNSTTTEITYNEFLSMLAKGDVEKVEIGASRITITPKEQPFSGANVELYTGVINDPNLVSRLEAAGVEFKEEIPDTASNIFWNIVISFAPLVIVWLLLYAGMRRLYGSNNMMGVGKSRAKEYVQKETGITFRDVAGEDEAKESLQEVVDFLENPGKYARIGAKLPKGCLLVGPPGTGKTLLARAVAGEAHCPFYSLSGSDFVEMFVGVGASRVRDLFDQAKKNAPCIVFIDEIDAVGRQRGAGLGGGHDEREQTLNQLLVEMDGFGVNEGIIMIAATNRPDILDHALLRPGRFDRQIVVDRPDMRGREAILQVHAKGKPINPSVDMGVIAKETTGFTGADLANLVNEAALLAARRNAPMINMEDMNEAAERVVMGPERRSHVMSEQEKRLTAYHETGHTLVGLLHNDINVVHKVTIIPRGRAGGYTMSLPKEDRSYTTKSEMLDELQMLLGGRVAEAIVLK